MSKKEIAVKFAELSDEANKANRKFKDRRFIPMSQDRNNRLHEFGMYDYEKKRYVLDNVHSSKAEAALKEIRRMISVS